MGFEIRYYNANHNKDDIKFVTEFPCFFGTPCINIESTKKADHIFKIPRLGYFVPVNSRILILKFALQK